MKERDNIWVQVSYRKEIPDHLVEHLWRYITAEGKIYMVGKITIKGKSYIYATTKEAVSLWDKLYGYPDGRIVAQDYFATKSKFFQQQTLQSQKSKSASQIHTRLPSKPK
jgi:hypothetical protein